MEGEGSVKVKGGKLVNAKVEFEEMLETVNIRGDFFIEPPEALEELENSIEGLNKDVDIVEIVDSLNDVDAELIGFSAEDVAEAVKDAVGDEE